MITAHEPRSAILYAHIGEKNLKFLHAEKKRLGYKTLSSYIDTFFSQLRIQRSIDSVPEEKNARKKK